MKTLVVLSALAAIAVAAPALSLNSYVGYNPVSYQITPTYRREKKSAAETNNKMAQLTKAQQFPHREIKNVAEVSRRTFSLKKPIEDQKKIIVKNNLGYHLYRNSDEQQAQPKSQVKCTKEVKVCNAKNLEARSSDRKENLIYETNHSKSDIEQSINKAKQAVEKLQHKKHDFKNSKSGLDAELHTDIEVAKQALQPIQKNFSNLETINMQAATFSNAEALQDTHLHTTKGERIAQWMEAINNIQRNVEIARNLEDGFTAANNQGHTMEQGKSNYELAYAHNHITLKSRSNDVQSDLDKLKAREVKTTHDAIRHQDMQKHKIPLEPKEPRAMKFAGQVHNSEQASLKERIPALHNNINTDLSVKMAERFNSDPYLLGASKFPTKAKHTQTDQITSAKNAAVEQNVNDFHNMDTQRVVTFDLPMSHHDMMPMELYHQPLFPYALHQVHYPSRHFYHNFHGMHLKAAKHTEAQEKAAGMDNAAQGTLQTNVNRHSGKSTLGHNTHWKQEQMAAREAYGSYGLAGAGVDAIGASAASLAEGKSSGPGAIGVFPHATAGGHASPLLLSCSPSVVVGSLAEIQSVHGGSAY